MMADLENKKYPVRKRNRLRDWDYSIPHWYYVTICTQNHRELFGEIVDGKMVLNEYGEIADKYWREIPNHFSDIRLDEYIIMPNHIHGIIIIEDPSDVRNGHAHSIHRQHQKLPIVIGSFKSSISRTINKMQNDFKFQWLKSYYDHIIRNEKSLYEIRRYIRDNLLKWDIDKNNPENLKY